MNPPPAPIMEEAAIASRLLLLRLALRELAGAALGQGLGAALALLLHAEGEELVVLSRRLLGLGDGSLSGEEREKGAIVVRRNTFDTVAIGGGTEAARRAARGVG